MDPRRYSFSEDICPICKTYHERQTGPDNQTPGRQPDLKIKPEKRDEILAAFSAIRGVKILCEEQANKERREGNRVVKQLDIKDVFYMPVHTYWDGGGQQPLFYIPDSAFDPTWDCDFTNKIGYGEKCERGEYPYERPYGWNRRAVNVLSKYHDDEWLGQGGWRNESSPGEWPVSYHGTKIQNVSNIVNEGYDIGKCVRRKFGNGIYSTPSPGVAERYATEFTYKGETMMCILQNRVNLKESDVIDKEKTGDGAPYFVTPNVDNIRPYGVCLKKKTGSFKDESSFMSYLGWPNACTIG